MNSELVKHLTLHGLFFRYTIWLSFLWGEMSKKKGGIYIDIVTSECILTLKHFFVSKRF